MKRALLVTYYFPPAGGVSAQRILKFARYLPDHGYLPTVLTVDPSYASYPALDATLSAQVPDAVEVIQTRSWDPFAVYAALQGKRKEDVVGIGFVKENQGRIMQRIGRWIRGNVFLPDARVGWIPFALRAARSLMQAPRPDVVLTTGPPHSAHLIGRRIQAQYGVPWVADFRDPWTDYFFNANMLQGRTARSVMARMERSVLSRADVVLSVSDAIGAGFRTKAPMRRYETLPNGYDAADLPETDCAQRSEEPFVLTHVGTLTREQHAPGLLRALDKLRDKVELRFVGHVHKDILRACAEFGIANRVRLIPFLPHDEAIAQMCQADCLLVSIGAGKHSKGIISGKVFEYLSTGVPILGLGPLDGDLAALLQTIGGGKLLDHEDASGIVQFLQGLISGTAVPEVNREALRTYDRKVLTRRLAEIFESL